MMDKAEEREAGPIKKLATGQGRHMHWEKDGRLWLTLIDDTPPGQQPRRNERSLGPFVSLGEVDRYLKEQVAQE